MLRNVFITASCIVSWTVATAAVTAVFALLLTWKEMELALDLGIILSGVVAALIAGAMAGVVFSAATLFFAAFTLPPTVALARFAGLPRPLVDCIGGGLAGLACSAMAIAAMEWLSPNFGGVVPSADMKLVFSLCAMIGGGATGYACHRALARNATLGDS
jgi:hypothetical protein